MKTTKKITKKILIILVLTILFFHIFNTFAVSKKTDIKNFNDTVFPKYFSWKNIDGLDYTTTIRNQELCKSDASFAIVASLETILQYSMGYPFYCDLSEGSLFYSCNGSFENGVNITRCADYLMQFGVPDEGCFPYAERYYNSDEYYNQPGWENRTIKIQNWSWVENDIDEIKNVLIQNGPVIVHINYSFNFINYKEGIYRFKGRTVGNQWVCIVGYDDEQGVWICRNSWGVNWGEDGYVKIPYDANIISQNDTFSDKSTGILSIDGTVGMIDKNIPIVRIFQPTRGLKYTSSMSRHERFPFNLPFMNERSKYVVFNKIFSNIFKSRIVDIRTPIVKNTCKIEVCAVRHSGSACIYVNDELMFTFNQTTFFQTVTFSETGLYTLRVEVVNDYGVKSVDIREFIVI